MLISNNRITIRKDLTNSKYWVADFRFNCDFPTLTTGRYKTKSALIKAINLYKEKDVIPYGEI